MNLYEILQSQKSSSSGTGTSFYGVAAQCGMKARIYERYPYVRNEEDEAEREEYAGDGITPTGRRKVSGKRAGAFYHKLQELWRLGTIPRELVIDASHSDYDFEVACRSFNLYRAKFGSPNNLGRVHSAEVTLPRNEEEAEVVKEAFGGHPFTIRYDLLTDVSQNDCARIAHERNLPLPGPGLYIVDYKLVASIGKVTETQYTYEFQQLAYPVIYNLLNPSTPVRGMITDVRTRSPKNEDSAYGLYLAHADKNAFEIVRDGIKRSSEANAEGQANPFVCIGKYGACGHLTSGLCPRFGSFDDFQWNEDRTRALKVLK